MSYDWTLKGTAYGKAYNAELTFVGQEFRSQDPELVEKHLETAGKKDDPEYRAMVEEYEVSIFKARNGDVIELTPRYVGSLFGSNDDGDHNTVCMLIYNGEYAALAFANLVEKEITAVEY